MHVATARDATGRSTLATLRGDLLGGVTTAAVMVAVEGSYGLVALAPLGPVVAPLAFLWGIYSTALANLVPALFGARGPMLSGPTAAMALLVPPLLLTMLADARFASPDGRPDVALLLAFVAAGIVLAGALQLALGAFRVGGIVRYVPYPVLAGVMNGVAVLMVLAMLPHVLGVGELARWRDAQPLTLGVALLTMWIASRPPSWTRLLPSHLTALFAGTATYHALRLAFADAALGPTLGVASFGWPGLDVLAPLARAVNAGLLRDMLLPLLHFAAAVALLSTLQSLLAASVIDSLTHRRSDAEHLLVTQGAANLASGVVGALPSAASVSLSRVNLHAGATSRVSRVAFAAALVLALVFGAELLRLLPMAAIAGVFIVVAFSLVDGWSRRATRTLLAQAARLQRPSRSLAQSYAVMLLVAGASVFASLPHGVAFGTLLAMLIFIRGNSRDPIRSVVHGDSRRSRKIRAPASAELLVAHGRRIALIELDGPLFFGTADAAAREIDAQANQADQIIIDFRRVGEVDASGARVLVQAAHAVRRRGKHLLLASLVPHDARMQVVRALDLDGTLSEADVFADADTALERAEDRLLETLAPEPQQAIELPLHETMLGRGLDVEEVAFLSALLQPRRIGRGEHVFHRGDAGDALFVSVRGQIGIWLPGDATEPARRLVSFAPGVVFGEMGMLQRQPRSTDAIAEDEAIVFVLSRADFERLAAERPALLGKLLLNLSGHLSTRVRALTDELQAALAVR